MLNLVKFELDKIFKRKCLWIFLFLMFLLSSFFIYSTNKNKNGNDVINFNYNKKIIDKDYKLLVKDKEKELIFYKSNNIKVEKPVKCLENIYVLIIFLSLFLVIICGNLMNKEYDEGIIKSILVKEKNRNKIIISKLIVTIIINFFFFILLFIINYFLTFIFTGSSMLNIYKYYFSNGDIVKINYLIYIIKNYFILFLPVLFISILSYFLSIFFNSSNLSTALSLFIIICGPIICNILLDYNISFIDYTILPYLDFNPYLDKINIFNINYTYGINLSICKGIFIFIILLLIMFYLSLKYFNKKDFN